MIRAALFLATALGLGVALAQTQTPPAQTPPTQTPPVQSPPIQSPPAQTPPTQTPAPSAPAAPAPAAGPPGSEPAPRPAASTPRSHAPALPLPQLVRKAEVALYARVLAPVTREEGGASWRVYPLDVQRTVWGNPALLPREGERPALWILEGVSGAPEFRENDDLLLLLYASRMDSPLVGFAQGAFRVQGGRVQVPASADAAASTPTLDDFVRTLSGLRGQP